MDAKPITQGQAHRKLDVGHVLFMDVVGYSRLMIEDQRRTIDELQEVVRELEEFRLAVEASKLIRLPTGDGMALVFFGDPEAPLRAAIELSRALRGHPSIKLRMGIHSGPVYRVEDINANMNVAGGGVNLAQRVMDCGDGGHILVSEDTARFFAQVGEWAERLHDLGKTRVKHGVQLHLYSLFVSEAGNPRVPVKLRRERRRRYGIVGGILATLTAGFTVLLWLTATKPSGPAAVPEQLTTNSVQSSLNAVAISPDGNWLAYEDSKGMWIREISSGVDKQLPMPQGAAISSPDWTLAWLPDSSELLASGPVGHERLESLWLFHPLVGPTPSLIAEGAIFPSVSPDSSRIAYIDADSQQVIWSMGRDGQNRRAILKVPDGYSFDSICWSPSGTRLAFLEIAPNPDIDLIGTIDLAGQNLTTVYKNKSVEAGPEGEFTGLTWLKDGRIVFALASEPSTKGSNLWAITVNSDSGEVTGGLNQITHDVDVFYSDLSGSANGRRLVFLRSKSSFEIWLARLDERGRSISGVEKFISEESNNWADGWTTDSKALLFASDRRGGARGIFRQAIHDGTPGVFADNGEAQTGATAVADGKSYLFWSWPKKQGDSPRTKSLIYLRDPLGSWERLLENQPSQSQFRCALLAPVCLLSEELVGSLRFSELDFERHNAKFVASLKIPVVDSYDWDISPDGNRVAAVHSSLSDNSVRILTLADGSVHDIPVPGWVELDSISWSKDGTAVYLAVNQPKNSAILRLDMNGAVNVVWRSESANSVEFPMQSPDGQNLAFTVESTGESNAWALSKF